MLIIPYRSADTANERILWSKRVWEEGFFITVQSIFKMFFSLSPEMLKNILAVMGLFAHILAGKNFLLND